MKLNVLNRLKYLYLQLNPVERLIIAIILICFIFPLTLPNWLSFGYVEVSQPKTKCDFLKKSIPTANQPVTDVIELGGRYHNRNCDVAQNVAIVVPYRNRAEHLKIFVHYMHLYLVNQNAINYQLFIVEQNDSLPFNRGNLLNIGFHEAQRIDPSFNCFIFHDVDILPSNLKQLYTCSDIPRHMCPYLDKFRYVLSYPNLFGGVISIKPEHFVQANGYSNAYSGWGGEDDDFYKRIRNHFPYIERYSPNISKCTMLRHGHLKANSDRHSLLKDALQRSHHEGLTTLNQTYILNSVEYNPLYVKLKIHLL